MKCIRLIYLLVIFTFFSVLEANHPIVYMVSPPRSLSTAFTRMMYERGDCAIYHEPTYHAFCKIYFPEYARDAYRKEAYPSFEHVKSELLAASEERMVFVKEMSNAVEEFLLKDSAFAHLEQLKYVFLLRNPHHAAISFYKKCPQEIHAMQEHMGYESLYRVYSWMEQELNQPLHIVSTEELFNQPEDTIRAFCDQMGISYVPEALNWKKLDDEFDVAKEWHEYKLDGDVELWHGNALNSSGFGKPSQYAVNEFGEPTFEEIADLKDRETVRQAYLYNLHFYQLLKIKSRP